MEMQMELSYVFAVVITGLVVVFLGLILLIAFISIVGKFFTMLDNKKKAEINQNSDNANTISKNAPIFSSSNDDDDEVIAVISAAVAMMSAADNTTYKIKSVRAAAPTSSSRNAWAMAGLKETTNPF